LKASGSWCSAGRHRSAVRSSVCCAPLGVSGSDRHRRVGFDGPLSAFGSRLALRVLLGRNRFALLWTTRASSAAFVHRWNMPPLCANPRSRAARPRAAPTGAFKDRVSPSAHPARLAYLRQEMPPPGYRRRTQGLSPSRRLDGHPCVPGLFHPGRAHGVLPSRAFSLHGAVTPLDARCLPDLDHRRFRAQPITEPHADERCADPVTRTSRSGRPSARGRRPDRDASC
jgi:hypothetical protein